MILGIDHIQLAMPGGQEDSARSFFGRLLGMAEVDKPPALRARGGCWFRHGEVHVHLGVEPDFRPARKAHPAFSVDDISAAARRVQAAGYAVEWDGLLIDRRRFYTPDPFGNRIEFIEALTGG